MALSPSALFGINPDIVTMLTKLIEPPDPTLLATIAKLVPAAPIFQLEQSSKQPSTTDIIYRH